MKPMKAFDLKEAKEGAKLVTRDGRPVRIICYDRLMAGRPDVIIGLVKNKKETFESLSYYNTYGQNTDYIEDLDLMIDDDQLLY